MLFFDTLIRFTGIGLLLALVILSIRDIRSNRSSVYLILSGLTVSALLVVGAPSPITLPSIVASVLNYFAIPHLVFVWLFALSLFQKDFTLKARHWLVGVVYVLPILLFQLGQYGVLNRFPFWWVVMVDIMSIALMAHLIFETLWGRSDDLQEKRRSSRVHFVIVIAFVAVSTALSEIIFSGELRPYLWTAKAFTIWVGILWACYWLFNISPATLEFEERRDQAIDPLQLSAQDEALRNKLDLEVRGNRAYLEAGLSISTLARRLHVTPHRLRALINTSLEFENFSTYINTYRIAAIKTVFADRQNDHLPILTVALEYGFNSLSPFNRAFKSIEGMTPSEYRKGLHTQ